MTNQTDSVSYETRPFSRWRIIMSDMMRVASEKNYVCGLLQIDVTEARRLIHAYKARTGDDFSFTAFLVGCIAQAVDENKAVQAMRQGNRLIIFDDVDINIQVEHDLDGEKVVSSHIIRAANRKSTQQVHDEIRAAQREKINIDLPVSIIPRWAWAAVRLPPFARRMILRRILASPFLIRNLGGTVNLTAVGMAGKGGGWALVITETPLSVAVGGIDQAVRWIDGQACMREMLSLTLSFDHDIIDGAPAARFAGRMKTLIEAAHGLEALAAPESAPTEEPVGG